jgi:hypothetical protein
LEELVSAHPLGVAAHAQEGELKLIPWQERHAILVLQHSQQLQNLRFALCPK